VSEYKHYVNCKIPGQLSFVTTTCLDWAHLFAREEMKTRMCLSLIRDCTKERAKLYGYVVMSNHIHLVLKPHDLMTISVLAQRIKLNSVTRLRKYFLDSELRQLQTQAGLNRHQYWQNSFRGNPLHSEKVSSQKLHYLHENPLRAGLVESPEQYLWSSYHILQAGHLGDDESIDLRAVRDFYSRVLKESKCCLSTLSS